MLATTILATTFALAAAEPAPETVLADLRFGFGVGPLPTRRKGTFTQVSVDSLAAGASYEDELADSPGMVLSVDATFGTLAPYGLIWGGGLRSTTGEQRVQSFRISGSEFPLEDYPSVPDVSYSDLAALGHVGFGYAVSPRTHLELSALVGVNWIQTDQIAINIENDEELIRSPSRGNGQTIGLRTGAYYTPGILTGWQIGLVGELSRTQADLENDYDASKTRTRLVVTGFGARVVLGYRF